LRNVFILFYFILFYFILRPPLLPHHNGVQGLERLRRDELGVGVAPEVGEDGVADIRRVVPQWLRLNSDDVI